MTKGRMDIDDVETVLSNLEGKKLKAGSSKLYVYSQRPKEKGDIISFGIPDLDAASGVGGIMRGKLVELFGPESGGKSFLTLKLMASAQETYEDRRVGLIDIEHSFDPAWASLHGVDSDNIIYGSDFLYGEDALNNMRALIESKLCSLVVLDSTAALIPKAELEAAFDQSKVAELGRMMSRAVRQIMDSAEKSNTAVVFVNQIRSKIGVMFGDPETTPGGRALKFYAHQRLRVKRIGMQRSKDSGKPIGILSEANFVKNKLAPPFEKAQFVIYFTAAGNHPVVKMMKQAHDVKMIRKKKDKDSSAVVYTWTKGKGKDKEVVDMDGPDFSNAGNWLVVQNRVEEFLTALEEKAKEEGVELLPEVIALKTAKEITSPISSSNDDVVVEKGDVVADNPEEDDSVFARSSGDE